MQVQCLRGPGVVAVAGKEPFQSLDQLGGVPRIVLLERTQIFALESIERIGVLDARDQAVDAELLESNRSIAAQELVADASGLFSLAVGADDVAGSRGPPAHAHCCSAIQHPGQVTTRFLE